MDDSFFVGGGEGGGDLLGDLDGGDFGQDASDVVEALVEVYAVDVFHGQVGDATESHPTFVDANDGGMLYCVGGFGLVKEAV